MDEFDDGFEEFVEQITDKSGLEDCQSDLKDEKGLSDFVAQEDDSSLEYVLSNDVTHDQEDARLQSLLSKMKPLTILVLVFVILGTAGALQSVCAMILKRVPFLGRVPGFSRLATLGSFVHRKGRGSCYVPVTDMANQEYDLVVLYNALCLEKRVISNPAQILQVKDFDLYYAMILSFVGYESYGDFMVTGVTSDGWFTAISADESTRITFRLPGSLDWADKM